VVVVEGGKPKNNNCPPACVVVGVAAPPTNLWAGLDLGGGVERGGQQVCFGWLWCWCSCFCLYKIPGCLGGWGGTGGPLHWLLGFFEAGGMGGKNPDIFFPLLVWCRFLRGFSKLGFFLSLVFCPQAVCWCVGFVLHVALAPQKQGGAEKKFCWWGVPEPLPTPSPHR